MEGNCPQKHRQFIHAHISNEGGLEFFLTAIYCSNQREERKLVWEALPSISLTINTLVCIAIGDFNEIRCPKERQGPDTHSHGGPSEFISATYSAHLMELPSIGGEFTWSNNFPGENFRQSRIDRAFTSQEWIGKWPDSSVEFYRGLMGDHAYMSIRFSTIQRGTMPFKVYTSWLDKPEFLMLARK